MSISEKLSHFASKLGVITPRQDSLPSRDSGTTVSDLEYLNALADNADFDTVKSYEKAKIAMDVNPAFQIKEDPIRAPGVWQVCKFGVTNGGYGGELPPKPRLISRDNFTIRNPYTDLEQKIRHEIKYVKADYHAGYFNIGPKDGFTSHAEAEKWLKTYIKGPNTTCYEADGKKVACV